MGTTIGTISGTSSGSTLGSTSVCTVKIKLDPEWLMLEPPNLRCRVVQMVTRDRNNYDKTNSRSMVTYPMQMVIHASASVLLYLSSYRPPVA